MKQILNSYLRPSRRRWALTQGELAAIAGSISPGQISRIERGDRPPSLEFAFACDVIFGVPPHELFPGLFSQVEEDVITRGYEWYDKLQGDPSIPHRTKLDLFEKAFARAKSRISSK